MSLVDQFMQDSFGTATDKELKVVSDLAKSQTELEQQLKESESHVKEVKEKLRQVQEVLLPNAMAEVGLEEFKLSSGEKITIKADVYASIRKDFLHEAINWLDEKGLGGVVKDKISVDFGRGESEAAKTLMRYCELAGWPANEALSVHPQTLKALVKEQLAQGVEFPDDYFSIAPVNKAIIKKTR